MDGDLLKALAGEDLEKADLRRRVDQLERRRLADGDLKNQLKEATLRVERIEAELRVQERIGVDGEPEWLTSPPKSKESRHATPWLFLSDLHLDEVVSPSEMSGVNAYNRKIAEMRLIATAENFVRMCRDQWSGHIYDGMVLPLGGDIFSGDIHEELKESNEDSMLGSLIYWTTPLSQVIRMMADEFGKVHVPVVVGNHGRTTRKPRAKHRARTNFDWALGHALARTFESDSRVTFDIPDSADCRIQQYDKAVMLTHGDQASGGAGIGGIWPPIMRLSAKKHAVANATGAPFDLLILGHWHQLVMSKDFVVNGCFPAGSKVITTKGPRPIQEVRVGDKVLSGDGTEQEVTNLFTKKADRLVGLKVKGLPDPLHATPNHLIWACKGASAVVAPSRRHLMVDKHGSAQWIPIDFISPGDFVHVPTPRGVDRPVSTEDAWAYGLYLAEGNAILDGGSTKKHNRICLTMHEREREIVERWARWFEGRFGKYPMITHRPGKTTTDLQVNAGREVSIWFRDTFGHRAEGKRIPDGALWWADDLKAALLEGWVTGDGHSALQDDCRPTVSATTVSERMAWDMFHLVRSSGSFPALASLAPGGRRKQTSYTVHMNVGQDVIEVDGEMFFRVIERFEQPSTAEVFDLEVSGEHTYCVGGVGVHNSLKGYDEYAAISNFSYEVPQQAAWLMSPEHGKTWSAPIFSQDREAEGW